MLVNPPYTLRLHFFIFISYYFLVPGTTTQGSAHAHRHGGSMGAYRTGQGGEALGVGGGSGGGGHLGTLPLSAIIPSFPGPPRN